ncbi:MAG: DUF3047 domain-containing protein [Cyanobacteria bacterium J06623_7]
MFKSFNYLLLLITASLALATGVNAGENETNKLKSITFGESNTLYSLRQLDKKLIIDAVGQKSASGLFIESPEACLKADSLSWSWRVDRIQPTADITVEEREDFAAAIMILFGKPGLFSKPKGLIYAFTNTDLPANSVVDSPRAPDNFRTIVLDNQDSPLKNWLSWERNIIDDYQLAYGELPDKDLHTIGVFTDNDQTLEPVAASYDLRSCNLSLRAAIDGLELESDD